MAAPAAHAAYGGRVDTHELLKRDMLSSNSDKCDDHFEKSRACPSEVYGIKDHYIVLDSYLAAERNPRKGLWRFNFRQGGVAGEDVVGVRDTINTLIEVEVAGSCVGLPPPVDPNASSTGLTLNGAVPTYTGVGTGTTQLSHCSRVTLQMRELGIQSFSDFHSKHHHFEFSAAATGGLADAETRLALTPVEERYVLTKPLQDLHGLTIQFNSPDEPLELPPSVIDNISLFADDVAGEFVIVGPATETTGGRALNFQDLLQEGDRIYLDNVNLDSTVSRFTQLNAFLGRPEGHFVGPAGIIHAPGTFTSPANSCFGIAPGPDLPAMTGYALGTELAQAAGSKPIRLRIAKNRVRVPMRLRCIVKGLTNYIAP